MTPAALQHYGSIWRKAYINDIGIGVSTKTYPSIQFLCDCVGWKIVDQSDCLYILAAKPDGQIVIINRNGNQIWCVDTSEFIKSELVEEVAEVYKAVRASSRKKSMGRPPLPPGQKRMRLHISLPPDLAQLAMQDPAGPSAYIEKFLSLAVLPSA